MRWACRWDKFLPQRAPVRTLLHRLGGTVTSTTAGPLRRPSPARPIAHQLELQASWTALDPLLAPHLRACRRTGRRRALPPTGSTSSSPDREAASSLPCAQLPDPTRPPPDGTAPDADSSGVDAQPAPEPLLAPADGVPARRAGGTDGFARSGGPAAIRHPSPRTQSGRRFRYSQRAYLIQIGRAGGHFPHRSDRSPRRVVGGSSRR